MVEIIYLFKQGRYPFGRQRPGPETYFEYVRILENDEEVNKAKQINQLLKQLDQNCIMKLKKIFKEDNNLHMIYDYVQQSLNSKLQKLQDEQELTHIFVALQTCFQSLINNKIKAQIYLAYMGLDHNKKLKVWIKPDQCEICQEKKQLEEFYQIERTRIHLQIQQVLQSNEQTSSQTSKGQSQKGQTVKGLHTYQKPNFVINGNQLVFKTSQPLSKNNQIAHKVDTAKQILTNIPLQNQKPTLKFQNKTSNQRGFQQKQLQNNPRERQVSKVQQKNLIQKVQTEQGHFAQRLQKQKPVVQIIQKSPNLKHKQQIFHKEPNAEVKKYQRSQQFSDKNKIEKQKPFQNSQNKNIHIRTELINKHKMRIITSQQIQLEGYDEKDLQRLADQKLKQLGKNSNMGKIQFEQILDKDTNSKHSQKLQKNIKAYEKKQYKDMHKETKIQTNQNKGNITNNSSENGNEGNRHNISEQMSEKITKAKERARQVLNQYSKKGKK